MTTLVGDRFVRQTAGSLDLATGAIVTLRVGPAPHDVERRARRCDARFATVPCGGARLIDYGPSGRDGWFEAETIADAGDEAPFQLRRLARAAVAEGAAMLRDPQWRGPRHVHVVAPSGSGWHIAAEDLARALRALGFVTIRADLSLPSVLRRDLRHRHIALLVHTAAAREAASEWSAQLCATSNRGHVVIERVAAADGAGAEVLRLDPCDVDALVSSYVAGTRALTTMDVTMAARESAGWPGRFARALARRHGGRPGLTGVARERAVVAIAPPLSGTWPFSVSRPSHPDVALGQPRKLLSRAGAVHRRGRLEAGTRWLSAGIESSRRRGDAVSVLQTLDEWVPKLIVSGRADHAARLAARALTDAADPATRATIAGLAARAYLESAQLGRAETCIDTALCIERLTQRGPSDGSLATRAALRLWQGRWQEGRAELDVLPSDRLRSPAIATWRELLCWADGDPARRWSGAGGGAGDRDHWAFAVRAFRAAGSGVTRRLSAVLTAESCPDAPADQRSHSPKDSRVDRAWPRVIATQAWLDLGDDEAGRRALGALAPARVERRGLVDCVLVALHSGLRMAKPADEQWLERVIADEGLRGVLRWGQGRTDMQMLHDMAALLEIVHTCEDEHIGLSQACSWTRTASGATGCVMVAAPAGDVLAGADLAELGIERTQIRAYLDRPTAVVEERGQDALARAPIRYGGAVIGMVLGVAASARARPLLAAVQAAAAVSGALARARLDAVAASVQTDGLARQILGVSPAIQAVRTAAARAANAPFPVVIEGESGTGKELVARALHALGPRRDRAFAALNCAALADELVEAELFGHARGAFTHAVNARAGLFEEAHQGTLFLDEVGELSPRAQAKLLRVLQEGEIRRVGENESRAVDVRVVAASNRPLSQLVSEGRFRDDLMFRLSVIRMDVPPLRARAGDVPVLALAFWKQAAQRVGTHALLGPDALLYLSQLSWPGNVRQLQNVMAAIAVAAPAAGRVGERLVRHVVRDIAPIQASTDALIQPLEDARRDVERRMVSAAIAKHAGSRAQAAMALGLSRQGLSKAMRRLGLVEAGVA